MTVYKPEAQVVARIKDLHDGRAVRGGTPVKTADGAMIPFFAAPLIAVDKTNIRSTILADHFVTASQICQDLPSDTDGICP